ncbi:MAG TPA: hypothetical protein VKK19_10200 [Candidatus Dormibacteraeota bacterium]|nr:hypothetical protein [Candidatus Dormibacteraeota bacterium]
MRTAAPADNPPAYPLSRRLRRHRRRRHSRIARSALTTASWTVVALAAMACLLGLILPDVR